MVSRMKPAETLVGSAAILTCKSIAKLGHRSEQPLLTYIFTDVDVDNYPFVSHTSVDRTLDADEKAS